MGWVRYLSVPLLQGETTSHCRPSCVVREVVRGGGERRWWWGWEGAHYSVPWISEGWLVFVAVPACDLCDLSSSGIEVSGYVRRLGLKGWA